MVFNEFFPDTAGVAGTDIAPVVLDPRITYYGKTPRATVLKHMREAHIHAYPAFTFEETCCLSQVEALATGCLTVVSDRGALPETTRGNGMIVGFTGNRDKDIETFAKRLAAAISVVHTGMWHPASQAADTMAYYSWEMAAERWSALHDRL
jgi:glycosyltransferase involved in cell wall biosynthesis